jgi:hypothetical protein
MDERVWLRHPETGGTLECPAEAVNAWLELGWQPSDPPAEPVSPVVAENLAWRERLAAEAAAELAAEQSPKPARRGESSGVIDG